MSAGVGEEARLEIQALDGMIQCVPIGYSTADSHLPIIFLYHLS